MPQLVSITSQGQLTIPKKVLQNFWSIGGSMQSADIKLTEEELRKARSEFSKKWPQK